MPSLRMTILAILSAWLLAACVSEPPPGLQAVSPFDIQRYLGQWYEIARLDHAFERGMSDVNASYQLAADGSVTVVNRGYDVQRQTWKEAIGRAVFVGDRNTGSLKVSFFGPFYGGYHVIALDQQDYRWALVAGPDRDYLWLLSRSKTLPAEVREQLLSKARALGFATDKLIWVAQNRAD